MGHKLSYSVGNLLSVNALPASASLAVTALADFLILVRSVDEDRFSKFDGFGLEIPIFI